MAYLADEVLDNGLTYLTTYSENVYICTADPGGVWSNIASYAIGSKSAPTVASPTDRTAGGREVIISSFSDGSATATGDATHYAITDDSATKILASSTLATTLSVTSGGSFGLEELAIGIPDPA